ncbi:hypothetical protein GCM10010520_23310 [Rhizobium viscosum]
MSITLYKAIVPVRSGDLTSDAAIKIGEALRSFLVEHNLLLDASEVVRRPGGMDIELYLEDLNQDGLDVMKIGFHNYLKRFERDVAADPFDVRILSRALAKVRSKYRH